MEVSAGVTGGLVPTDDINLSKVGVVCLDGYYITCCVSRRGV